MKSFRMLIPDKRKKSFHLVSLFIFVLNLFVFIRMLLQQESFQKWIAITGLVVCISGIFFSILYRNKKPGWIHVSHFALLTLIWMLLPAWVPAICIAVFASISFIAAKDRWIRFDKSGIHYPSFPQKKFSWKEVNSVIYKDNVLTIDFDDNRLIQLIFPEKNIEGNISDINSLCKGWIISARHAD